MNVKRGITWTLMDTLEDLDFADDIVILAHRHQDIHMKTNDVNIVLRTSNFQRATMRPIVPRHKHSIVFIVHH